MHRRGLLRGLGTATLALGSGCLTLLDATHSRYLDDVTLQNGDDAPHEFGLTVEQGDAIVHETTVELGNGRTLATVSCDWSGRGPFVVRCTLDGDSTETVRVDDAIQQGTGAHAHVTFIVSQMGALDWSGYVDDGGRRCPRSPSE